MRPLKSKATRPSSSSSSSLSSPSSSASPSLPSLPSVKANALYPLPTSPSPLSSPFTASDASGRASFSHSVTLWSEKELPAPPGYLSGSFSSAQQEDLEQLSRLSERLYSSAMNVALAPGKQLFMTALMMWMSGNTLQPYSIVVIGMALWPPLQKIASGWSEFARFQSSADSGVVNLTLPKLAFLMCNLAGVALALWKMNSMGLLPTSTADWLSSEVRPSTHVALEM